MMPFFNYKKIVKKGYMGMKVFFYYGIHIKCTKRLCHILLKTSTNYKVCYKILILSEKKPSTNLQISAVAKNFFFSERVAATVCFADFF